MAVLDLFSKRQRRLRGEQSDVFRYDILPEPLRVQIIHILQATISPRLGGYGPQTLVTEIVENLRREYGAFQLVQEGRVDGGYGELCSFILGEQDIERVLDAVELVFKAIDKRTRGYTLAGRQDADKAASDAILELNVRFREHAVGYAFENGEIIRVDSQYLHQEVTKPALAVLSGPKYDGAQQEYLTAHEHFRKGDNKDCLVYCLKSLESVLKTVCSMKGWKYDKDKATAKDLIDICFSKGLVPQFWQTSMSGLRAILENGVPTARSRLAAHGQGLEPLDVPNHITAFVMHITGATIVFLSQAAAAK